MQLKGQIVNFNVILIKNHDLIILRGGQLFSVDAWRTDETNIFSSIFYTCCVLLLVRRLEITGN